MVGVTCSLFLDFIQTRDHDRTNRPTLDLTIIQPVEIAKMDISLSEAQEQGLVVSYYPNWVFTTRT